MVTSQANEQWRPVVGYESRYEVSDCGRVRSRSYGIMRQYMHGGRGRKCYPAVQFRERGTRKIRYCKVHRLVLEAFVGPCPEDYVACHANDDPTDNRLDNLRWATRSANTYDSIINGGHYQARKTHCKQGHEYTSENTYFYTGGLRRRNCRACGVAAQRRYVATLAGRP